MNQTQTYSSPGRGFTLIELLVVLILIALLAALALPHYVALTSPARAAKARTAYGAIRSAAAMTKSQCLVGGGACGGAPSTGNTLLMEGKAIPMAYAYPAADGIQEAAGLSSDDYQITAGNPVTFAVPGAQGACRVMYAQPEAKNTTPTVTLDISGC